MSALWSVGMLRCEVTLRGWRSRRVRRPARSNSGDLLDPAGGQNPCTPGPTAIVVQPKRLRYALGPLVRGLPVMGDAVHGADLRRIDYQRFREIVWKLINSGILVPGKGLK
jgi:hypothetical protein